MATSWSSSVQPTGRPEARLRPLTSAVQSPPLSSSHCARGVRADDQRTCGGVGSAPLIGGSKLAPLFGGGLTPP
jgi:hypothetical protein